MIDLVMHWKRGGVILLPYLDDFLFMAKCFWQCDKLARKAEADVVRDGWRINVSK